MPEVRLSLPSELLRTPSVGRLLRVGLDVQPVVRVFGPFR